MPLSALLLASASLAAAPAADLQTTNPDLWREEFDRVEADIGPTIRTWIAATQAPTPGAEAGDALDELAALRARRGALRTERELRQEAIRASSQRITQWRQRGEACPTTEAGIATDIAQLAEETATQLTAARAQLEREGYDRRATLRALNVWWEIRQAMDWEHAWDSDDGLDALMKARHALDEEAARLAGPTGDALSRLRMQADDEERRRLDAHRTRLDCQALEVEPPELLAVQDSEVRLRALEGELAEVELRLSELEHAQEASPEQEQTGLQAELALLDDSYRHLAGGLNTLEAPVDQQTWCSVLIHGALVRLAVHGADAEDLLDTAAASRDDVCLSYAQSWLDVPIFQSAWVLAVTNREAAAPLLRVEMNVGGDWTVDGLPVLGWQETTIDLRPGLHRVEHRSPRGAIHATMLQLAADDRVLVRIAPAGVSLGEFDPKRPEPEDDDKRDVTTLNRDEDDGSSTDPEPGRRLALTLAPAWVRFDGMNHTGGSIQLGYSLLRRPWLDLQVGLAHDQVRGPETYAYADDRMASRFLLRERLTVAARGGEDWPLRPILGASVGTIPLNAGTFSTEAGLEIPMGDRLFLAGTASLGFTFWNETTTPWEPAGMFGVGARL